jgi:hypothetical protein
MPLELKMQFVDVRGQFGVVVVLLNGGDFSVVLLWGFHLLSVLLVVVVLIHATINMT